MTVLIIIDMLLLVAAIIYFIRYLSIELKESAHILKKAYFIVIIHLIIGMVIIIMLKRKPVLPKIFVQGFLIIASIFLFIQSFRNEQLVANKFRDTN